MQVINRQRRKLVVLDHGNITDRVEKGRREDSMLHRHRRSRGDRWRKCIRRERELFIGFSLKSSDCDGASVKVSPSATITSQAYLSEPESCEPQR